MSNRRPPLQTEDIGARGDWNVSRVHSDNLTDLYQFLDGVGPRQRVWIVAHGYIREDTGSGGVEGDGYLTLMGSVDNARRDEAWFRERVDGIYNTFDSVDFFDVHFRPIGTRRKPSIPSRYR